MLLGPDRFTVQEIIQAQSPFYVDLGGGTLWSAITALSGNPKLKNYVIMDIDAENIVPKGLALFSTGRISELVKVLVRAGHNDVESNYEQIVSKYEDLRSYLHLSGKDIKAIADKIIPVSVTHEGLLPCLSQKADAAVCYYPYPGQMSPDMLLNSSYQLLKPQGQVSIVTECPDWLEDLGTTLFGEEVALPIVDDMVHAVSRLDQLLGTAHRKSNWEVLQVSLIDRRGISFPLSLYDAIFAKKLRAVVTLEKLA